MRDPGFCGSFGCIFGHCIPTAPQNEGQPCDDGQACTVNDRCQFGYCLGTHRTCPDTDGNKCTIESCNPADGTCASFTNDCSFDPCSVSGTCNPSTGKCQAKAVGTACNDFNVCTSNDTCQDAGFGGLVFCQGVAGPIGPTTPPTTGPTATATPTRTPTAIATSSLGPPLYTITLNNCMLTGVPCPNAGAVAAITVSSIDLVSYTGTGGVELDLDDGSMQTFTSCLDARLFQCPAP